MPNKNYAKGRRAEYELKANLEAEGYLVLRTAGSHGPVDLIAIPLKSAGPVRLIQVKSYKQDKNETTLNLPAIDYTTYHSLSFELWTKVARKGWKNERIGKKG